MNIKLLSLMTILITISSCKTGDVSYKYPKSKEDREIEEMGSIITGDENPIELVNGKSVSKRELLSDSFLWRAALEVISFMPIASSDAVGGTIITDWYSDSKTPNERFKFNIIIASNKLDATNLKVKGFKQIMKAGNWLNVKMNEAITDDLENKILTQARKLKVANF